MRPATVPASAFEHDRDNADADVIAADKLKHRAKSSHIESAVMIATSMTSRSRYTCLIAGFQLRGRDSDVFQATAPFTMIARMADGPESNIWNRVLERLGHELDGDELRRWFSPTAYASDSGDRITVWAPSESIRRQLVTHYDRLIRRTLAALGRPDTSVRVVVSGFGDEDEEEDT